MRALALFALLAAVAAPVRAGEPEAEARIDVLVLTRLRPRSAVLEGPRECALLARGERIEVEGQAAPVRSLALPEGRWTVRIPGEADRGYRGAMKVTARGDELRFVVTLRLEDYVAETVASETTAGTPVEALKAQAVVSRSYARARLTDGTARHGEAHVCDLAHCQVLRGRGQSAHRQAARRAARATLGEVLTLGSGEPALAPFHAACAGHTADPTELFGGADRSGAAAVPDVGCAAPWRAELTEAQFQRAVRRAFGLGPGGEPAGLGELRLERGAGGYVVRLVDALRGSVTSGDRFARALDAELGFRGVRSSRFTLIQRGGSVRLEGSGLGHGAGLCQAGASRLARQGLGYHAILGHYFPRARLTGPGLAPSATRPAMPRRPKSTRDVEAPAHAPLLPGDENPSAVIRPSHRRR